MDQIVCSVKLDMSWKMELALRISYFNYKHHKSVLEE